MPLISTAADATPVTTGLKLCLDATQGAVSRGNTVIAWTDQSGYIAEVLVYDGALSPEDQAAVADYLQAKWVLEPGRFMLAAVGIAGLLLYRHRGRRS